jgi:hypothetical protein
MTDLSPIIVDFLNELESHESRLLSWGIVDGSFDEEEIAGHAERYLNDQQIWDNFPDPMDLVDSLLDRRLLFAFIQGTRTRYRTRMAEAVRLISKLRQLFPGRPWQLAPTLVADYRLARVPRRYPRREIVPEEVFSRLETDVRLTRLRRDALAALLRVGQADELRLAEFQFQAIRRMLRDLDSRNSRGLIIGAGTGTGKTLAFYIPALTHLAVLVQLNEYWTKGIAIYPRNELLKDQFSETYAEARRLDPLLLRQGNRKIVLGAFFGLTPRNAAELKSDTKWGRPRAGGYVCPYLRCPRCDGDLVWRTVDLDRGEETLHCLRTGCASVVRQDEVMLTRERMKATPPDVFFSTTEMLNRRMSDKEYGHLFGIGPSVRRRPQLMLLDEVHTYVGTSGAQVAMLLRRWQRALGSIVQFTGLSATLKGATNFFEQLVGLRPGAVEEVSPRESELDLSPESVEYVMAVRGDPVGATSLLSTSIQTAMLLGRILDPRQSNPSQGIYGKRVFAFTDDLDVTNRFYNNLQDAEGLDSWSQPQQPAKAPLASLRSPSAGTDNALRFIAGQSWQMCEDIGHPVGLAQPLHISRTSSQDVGVAQSSNIVVATAALEVGYNDPEVGAVMQHKAPRDWAAFVQRKGRAGRRRKMRPWTIVTLSDYGRDRVAYQAYDQFFSPELPVRSLPVSNRYVLRMQAAFALMDWVARELPQQAPTGSVWRDFSGPSDTGWWANNMKARQNFEVEILKAVLDCNSDRSRSLAQYIQSALGLTTDETQSILWDAPRPLMLSVIPTILRRLESDWRRVQSHPDEPARDHLIADHPLPDFVPQQLFGDLNLPEVEITLDLQGKLARFKLTDKSIRSLANDGVDESVLSKIAALKDGAFVTQEHFLTAIGKVLGTAELRRYQDVVLTHAEKATESEFVPIVQALKTLTPGRVTRRFGHRHRFANHWIPLPSLQDHNQVFPVEKYCIEFEEAGNYQVRDGINVRDVRCLRPWKIHPGQPPANVAVTSNSVLEWRSQIAPSREDDRLRFEPPRGIGWDQLLDEIRFFTHHQRNHAVVRRFAVGTRANVSFRDGTQLGAVVRFVNQSDSAPAAVGFSIEADAIAFRFRMPADLGLAADHPNQRKVRAFRAAYFRHRVQTEPLLDQFANRFQRDWLAQIYLSALVRLAIESGIGIEDAHRELHSGDIVSPLTIVLDTIFQSLELPNGQQQSQRVHDDLLILCRDRNVTDSISNLARVLWEPPDQQWQQWAGDRFKASVGGALLEACVQSCPQMEAGDLYLDIDAGPRPPDAPQLPPDVCEVWVTESTIGGGGIIEEVLRSYVADPRQFFRIAESALAPTDFEIVDRELTRLLELTTSDAELNNTLNSIRQATSHAQLTQATMQLRRSLAQRGFSVTHAVLSAVHSRILRSGSSQQSDALLRRLVGIWNHAEETLGVELDSRVVAFLASQDPAVQAGLSTLGAVPANDDYWRYQTIYGLLWPRGSQVRGNGLSFYNPFAATLIPDRDIVRDLIQCHQPSIRLAPGCCAEVDHGIASHGAVRLVAATTSRQALKDAILRISAVPIEVDYLHLFPTVVSLTQDGPDVAIALDTREVLP